MVYQPPEADFAVERDKKLAVSVDVSDAIVDVPDGLQIPGTARKRRSDLIRNGIDRRRVRSAGHPCELGTKIARRLRRARKQQERCSECPNSRSDAHSPQP